MFIPGLLLFYGDHPANPFIAGKGGKAVPFQQRVWVRHKGLLQVRRQIVYNSSCDFYDGHWRTVVGEAFLPDRRESQKPLKIT